MKFKLIWCSLVLILVYMNIFAPITLGEKLIDAAMSGSVDQVKALLDDGADVDSKDDFGLTPLIYAASLGYTDLVKLLIERGADVRYKDETGATALKAATSAGHTSVIDLLKKEGAEE